MKEKQLQKQEEKIVEANKDVDAKLQELAHLKDENTELTKSLEAEKNSIEHNKQILDSSKHLMKTYSDIQKEVEANHLSIDSEVESLRNDKSLDFPSRLNRFVSNVKKIVTALSSEIGFYKSMFKSFWNKCASDLRKIADTMDRNNCKTYSDYYQKFCSNQLDYQIAAKKSHKISNNAVDKN